MSKQVRFTRMELESMLDAVNAAEAGEPTDWQDAEMGELGGEGDPRAEAWLERSQAALESSAAKLQALLARLDKKG